jgi:hypothetical protein
MYPTSCLIGSWLESYLPSAWLAHFYLMKNRVVLYFGLDCVMLDFFTHETYLIKRTSDVSPAFLEHGSAEKIVV